MSFTKVGVEVCMVNVLAVDDECLTEATYGRVSFGSQFQGPVHSGRKSWLRKPEAVLTLLVSRKA